MITTAAMALNSRQLRLCPTRERRKPLPFPTRTTASVMQSKQTDLGI